MLHGRAVQPALPSGIARARVFGGRDLVRDWVSGDISQITTKEIERGVVFIDVPRSPEITDSKPNHVVSA